MSLPSWIDAPFTWDVLGLAGDEVPGLAKVKATRKYKLDKKDQAGADGGDLTGLGHMPAEVEITLRIWNTDQFNDLQALLPKIMVKPGKGVPSPVDASHPALTLLGIKSLYITEISAPMETSTKQVYELTLQATEFLPVKKKNVTLTPTMSATTADVPVEPGLIPPSESDTGP